MLLFVEKHLNQNKIKEEEVKQIIMPQPAKIEEELEEHDPVYQRRLLPGQIITRTTNMNGKVPTTKKFWSITEFNKLRDKDKELIKQEIVRTLVAFQKKTFCVFEERDQQIKNFLLNSPCDSKCDCCLYQDRIELTDFSRYGHLHAEIKGN